MLFSSTSPTPFLVAGRGYENLVKHLHGTSNMLTWLNQSYYLLLFPLSLLPS